VCTTQDPQKSLGSTACLLILHQGLWLDIWQPPSRASCPLAQPCPSHPLPAQARATDGRTGGWMCLQPPPALSCALGGRTTVPSSQTMICQTYHSSSNNVQTISQSWTSLQQALIPPVLTQRCSASNGCALQGLQRQQSITSEPQGRGGCHERGREMQPCLELGPWI